MPLPRRAAATMLRQLPASLALLTILLPALAVPAPPQPNLPTLHRLTTYEDIPSTYSSIYKISPSCPDTVVLGQYTIDDRQVALIPMASIQEDSQICTGSSDMIFVSEATVEQPGLLTALSLPGFRAALDANTNADNLIKAPPNNTLMAVGWHSAPRTCGTAVYLPTNIYFVLREDIPFTLAFKNGTKTDTITLPPFLKSLFIISTDSKLCVLVDPNSNPSAEPTVSTDDGAGNVVTSVLVPAGSSQAPTADTSATSANSTTPVSSGPDAPASSPSAAVGVTAPTVAPPEPSPSSVAPPIPSPSAGVVAVPPEDSEADIPLTSEPVPTAEIENAIEAGDVETSTPDPETTTAITPTETETDSEPQDDGSACFPADAAVLMEDGTKKKMKQLEIGDRVADGDGGFTDVIFFTHRHSSSQNAFVRLITVSGHMLTVSRGHYVYANGGLLCAAESLHIGEGLDLAEDMSAPISFIEGVSAKGLYNPQTASGSLVVNGFKVSTYTTAIHPRLAHHVLMAPVRWLYSVSMPLAAALASTLNEGSPPLARMLPSGPAAL